MADLKEYMLKHNKVELKDGTIRLNSNGMLTVEFQVGFNDEELISELFEAINENGIRFCTECGAPMDTGWTDEVNDYFCSEECLKANYDRYFGEGNWYASEKGRNGSRFYFGKDPVDNEYYDTGLYYTEWY